MQRASLPTCVWCSWWLIFYGSSSGKLGAFYGVLPERERDGFLFLGFRSGVVVAAGGGERMRLFPRENGIGVETLTSNLHFMSLIHHQIFSHRRLGAGQGPWTGSLPSEFAREQERENRDWRSN